MNSKNRLARVVVIPLLLVCLWTGCLRLMPTGSALEPGENLPRLSAEGWINGDDFDPSNLSNQVLVVVAFATW